MQEPQPTVLVTAFEPFGPPGGPKRPENASEVALEAFRAERPRGYRFVVLPVDPRCEVLLARALQAGPAGIIAMGETGQGGAWDTNVEPAAWDRPVVSGAPEGEETGSGRFLTSEFAASLPLLDGMDREPRIGSYWCNRVYWRVLEWNLVHGVPAVFLHLRVGGDRARQEEHLAHVAAHMERARVPARR